jgi:hypothetical protein
VCSDSGFTEEAKELVYQVVGPDNVLLVQLERPGKSFTGDSRSYIELHGVKTIRIENTGALGEYHAKIAKEVVNWLARKTVNVDTQCKDGFCPMPSVRQGPSESMFPPVN